MNDLKRLINELPIFCPSPLATRSAGGFGRHAGAADLRSLSLGTVIAPTAKSDSARPASLKFAVVAPFASLHAQGPRAMPDSNTLFGSVTPGSENGSHSAARFR
jgi:hypothetical protein